MPSVETDGTEGEVILMSNDYVAGYLDPDHPQRKYYKCRYCGNPFWKENAFRMKFCSTECQKKACSEAHPKKIKVPSQPVIKACEWCGKEYEAKKNQKYCCKECAYEGNKRLQRELWAKRFVPRKFKCKECGTEFTTECGNPRSVFCCQFCADIHKKKNEKKRTNKYNRASKERRRQLLAQATESVDYGELYRRDKGICQICGLPVHPVKLSHNSWDGTIDHIIPLSCGGKHSMSNCQLAHRICNSLKSTEADAFSLNWNEKRKENNYWNNKYLQYEELMSG